MVGLGMPEASRLSSIWAGRCEEKKTTTQRARSPSGDQFMVLALSLPVKKQISWCVLRGGHWEDMMRFSLSCFLLHSSYIYPSTFFCTVTFCPFCRFCSRLRNQTCTYAQLHFRHTNTHVHAVTYIF